MLPLSQGHSSQYLIASKQQSFLLSLELSCLCLSLCLPFHFVSSCSVCVFSASLLLLSSQWIDVPPCQMINHPE